MPRSPLTFLMLPMWLLLLSLVTVPPAHALCYTIGTQFSAPVSLCWNRVHPVLDAHDIEGMTWSSDRNEFLAVGAGGVILAGNADGSEWTPRNSGSVERLYGALWDGSRYIVVGDGGLLMTSPDGIDWTPRMTNTRLRLLDITHNGSVHVAVGEQGVVLYSTDTVTWSMTSVISPSRQPALYAVIHHDGHFIAVGSSAAIVTSSDGSNWVERNYITLTPGGPTPTILRGIAAAPDGRLLAVGSQGSVYTSARPDGNWTRSEIPGFADARLFDVAADTSEFGFIAVGERTGNNEPLVLRSADGSGWQSGTDASLEGFAPALLKTIGIGNAGRVIAGNRLLLTTAVGNDLDWQANSAPAAFTTTLNDVIRFDINGAARYLATGVGGHLLASDDGFDWRVIDSGAGTDLHGIAWNGNDDTPLFVAVGGDGTIIRSVDGEVWTTAALPPGTGDLQAVTHGHGLFVAVGENGAVLTSPGGESWNAIDVTGTTANLQAVTAAANDHFVAVGDGGTILLSTDAGVNWGAVTSGTTRPLTAIARGDDGLVVVGETGGLAAPVVLQSVSGQSWIAVGTVPPGPSLRAVAWNGTQYIAAGDNGRLLRSATGSDWATFGTPLSNQLIPDFHALTTTGDRFIAVGNGGAIASSGGVDLAVGIDTDVSVSEDDDPSFARAGADKTFRFTITNTGNLDARDIAFTYLPPVVETTPPAPLEVVQVEPDDGWTCDPVANDGSLTCRTDRLPAATGDSPTMEITVAIPDIPESTITHLAELSTPGDINPANDLIAVDTRVQARIAPALPSPDTDFSSRGAFGALHPWQLALLFLIALYFLPQRTISRR